MNYLFVRLLLCWFIFYPHSGFAQTSQAIVMDGNGPWRDERWVFTANQFTSILRDAGYTVTTVSPADIPAAIAAGNVLLAAPSLESLPVETMKAIGQFASSGGSLMASGGEPFRNPLNVAPSDTWIVPNIPTISPAAQQYTTSSGRRVPVVDRRGLYGAGAGRIRVIGDVSSPAATIFSDFVSGFLFRDWIVWVPWPQPSGVHRAELVAAIRPATAGVRLQNAGLQLPVWLVGESITGQARVINMSKAPVQATLRWSIAGSPQPPIAVPLAAEAAATVELRYPSLPRGEYPVSFSLMVGDQEVDRINTPLRVFDPAISRDPDQKIQAKDGAFYAGGKRVYLHGVNYWPRYALGFGGIKSWLTPEFYDPVQVEADLALMESLNFNVVNIRYAGDHTGWAPQARSLIDFLERCRNHGIWVRIEIPATLGNNTFRGTLNPQLGAFLSAAFLPGHDRVFAYEFLWEPYLGMQKTGGYNGYLNGEPIRQGTGRAALDGEWRTWVDEQYGSLAVAQQAWGIDPPRNESGQLTNPTDEQLANDGPWRILVAAYRRFADDYLGRGLGVVTRETRRADPTTLMTYRNWNAMTEFGNANMGYDLGTGAAHLDFLSPENYDPLEWPARRKWGLQTAYSRYRGGGKAVQMTEFGYSIGASGDLAPRASQTSVCDAAMRLIEEDGTSADTVWWWPGGVSPVYGGDFGILDPDGTPRGCASVLARWGAKFRQTPPGTAVGPATTFTIDRDADARGQYGLFLRWADAYASAAGQAVRLVDAGTGTDTSTMPLVQVGNVPYNGTGPLKFANSEVGGLQVVCPGIDVMVENGAQVRVPAGATCRVTLTVVNTGQARWLPAASANGGVSLHTSAGDVPLAAALDSLQRASLAPIEVKLEQSAVVIAGRMRIGRSSDFGEVLRLTLAPDAGCAATLSAAGSISTSAAGGSSTISITTGTSCAWSAQSMQPWVSFNPATGTGSGQVGYTVQANVGPPRQTSIVIAGRPLTVVQAGTSSTLVSSPSLSTPSLSFGSQTLGTASSTQTVAVTNTAASVLDLASIGIGGRHSVEFTQTNTCGAALAAGASCSIAVRFAPTQVGARSAALYVGGMSSVALSGVGVDTGAAPVIEAIVDVWNYTAGIAPGTWVTIGGTGFSPFPQIANLGASEQLPTRLGGTSVTFNGVPAVVAYVSPTQINALVPASIVPGSVAVVVESDGAASRPFTTAASATHPAIYALPDSSRYSATAALQGTGFLVGNSAIDARVNRAVYPGDVIDLYMIGLGATTDRSAFITDRQFAGVFPVEVPVTATIGGQPAPVIFAGLTGPGLYLVRVSIPSGLQPGAQPIEVVAGNGSRTSPLLSLMIASPPASISLTGTQSLLLRPGQVYRLSLRAKAATRLLIMTGEITIHTEIAVSKPWQQHVVYFRTADDASVARIEFDTADVWIEDIVLHGSAP